MHEVKQRVKEKLQAGTADGAAVTDTLRLPGLDDETQPSAPTTARSIATPTGKLL